MLDIGVLPDALRWVMSNAILEPARTSRLDDAGLRGGGQGIMEAMLLDRLRTRAVARMLRRQPVLVVPPAVTAAQVEGYAAQWSPDRDRLAETVLELGDVFEVHGPLGYHEALRRRSDLPPEFPHAYAVAPGPDAHLSVISDWTRYDLVRGLARRLGGRCRVGPDKPWEDPNGEPACPLVVAPRALSADDALGFLDPYLPGLQVAFQDEDGYWLDIDAWMMHAELSTPAVFPLVHAQSWFASAETLVEYEFGTDGTSPGRERVEAAAQALATATGGVLLDENGFPWQTLNTSASGTTPSLQQALFSTSPPAHASPPNSATNGSCDRWRDL
jgi:hypothetical protein